ncbi:acetoacetate--CoA ligase [Endozoicomonas sp. OPT23]|uniref:acetoacetate--CoA ligase n=1 Tax=Endozoicomonas sp. OPT23 TaxID=2072845 RepID=UPI00129A4F17|nr:acetoacetate--CoA ligase [Endozoicomonas sp. OPT23]MRI34056.1 acetoacetate--CoA ligase [Endozoicomonas sp. OPT23]
MTLLWKPSSSRIKSSNMDAFRRKAEQTSGLSLPDYPALYQWSVSDRSAFWQLLAEHFDIKFHQPPGTASGNNTILGRDTMPGAEWFPDSTLNYAEHLLRRKDDHTAVIFRGEKGQRRTLNYQQLHNSVAQAQAGLIKLGVSKGDRIAAFVPNCPETVIMMLAATALGAVWSSCSPDFGFQGVLDRFGQIEPKLLVTVDGYYYGGKTIDCRSKVADIQNNIASLEQTVVISFIEQDDGQLPDISALTNSCHYSDFLIDNDHSIHFEPVAFNHPLFIMYSSGTTGVPKCIVHGHGGTLLQHLKELSLHSDLKPEDKIFYFTTCGWMMWNWLVSSLATGSTLVLYDGSPTYPETESLMDMAEQEQVTIFGTSAKYIAALEKAGVKPKHSHNLEHLKAILSTGSPLLHESFDYVYRDIKEDVCLSSISGGTDIVSCFALGCPTLPVYRGELQCRGLGMAVEFVDDSGLPLQEQKGELVCQQSFPSMPVGFWNDTDGSKYHKAYFSHFENIWAHGDYGELTEHGGVVIHGRADAVLNPGGVRIGTAEIYRQVEKVDGVLESIAIGQEWQGDVRVVLFVKLKESLELNEKLIQKIRTTIRSNTTPRHVPAVVLQVADIPRTISGKIVELAVREVVHGRPVANTDALANPEALDFFRNRNELSPS